MFLAISFHFFLCTLPSHCYYCTHTLSVYIYIYMYIYIYIHWYIYISVYIYITLYCILFRCLLFLSLLAVLVSCTFSVVHLFPVVVLRFFLPQFRYRFLVSVLPCLGATFVIVHCQFPLQKIVPPCCSFVFSAKSVAYAVSSFHFQYCIALYILLILIGLLSWVFLCVCVCVAILLAVCAFDLLPVVLVLCLGSSSPSPGIMHVWHYVLTCIWKQLFVSCGMVWCGVYYCLGLRWLVLYSYCNVRQNRTNDHLSTQLCGHTASKRNCCISNGN